MPKCSIHPVSKVSAAALSCIVLLFSLPTDSFMPDPTLPPKAILNFLKLQGRVSLAKGVQIYPNLNFHYIHNTKIFNLFLNAVRGRER